MKRPEQANWLDDAIAKTVPGEPPRPDFATWQGAHARAMASLTRRAQRKTQSPAGLPAAVEFGRRIMRSPITKLAVAAALIVGIFVLANHLIGRESEPTKPEPQIVAPAPTPKPQPPTELAQAQTLYEQGDITGLVALLQSGASQTQLKVAEYLAQIGDASALSALQPLAAQWQGDPDANPFQNAIDAIGERQAQPTSSDEIEDTASSGHHQLDTDPGGRWTFQAHGVLSGVVTDAATGYPVVGADVKLLGNPQYDVKTDTHGVFCIERVEQNGNYKLRVHSKMHLSLGTWAELPVVALASDTQVVKHFKLLLGCAVDVDILNEQGDPIEDAKVAASWLGSQQGDRPDRIDLGEDQTDANGQVTIGAFEPFEVEYRIIACHEKYAPGYVNVKLIDPNVIPQVQIVLNRGIDVPGFAEYADGLPAKGVRISVRPDWWHSSRDTMDFAVDAQGAFTLQHVASGTYGISATFERAGGRYSTRSFVTQSPLPLPEGETLTLKLARKSPLSSVSIGGKIVWLSERRPNSLEILAHRASQGISRSVDISGKMESFEIDALAPGVYTLRFRASGLDEHIIENVVAPSDNLEVVLDYHGAPRLTGSVVDMESQSPIDAFKARLVKLKTLRGSNSMPSRHLMQCADGAFDLETVGPGIYLVQVMAPGYAPMLSRPINTDEETSLALQLTRGGRLEGYVTNEKGDPLTGAKVVPLSSAHGNGNDDFEEFVTDEGAVRTVDGRFAFAHLPAGRETLKVTHPDYTGAIVRDIEIVEGRQEHSIDIVLTRGTSIEGIAYDASGTPQSGVSLFVYDQEGYRQNRQDAANRLGTAVTDANGFYRIDRLPVGTMCCLTRSDAGSTLGVVRRACVTTEGTVTRLDLGGQPSVSGTLRKDGRPIARTRIIIASVDNYNSRVYLNIAETDESGYFAARGVPAGRYGVYYQNPEGRNKMVRAAIVDVGTDGVNMGRIDLVTTRIEVKLRRSAPDVDLSSWRVTVHEAPEFWKGRVGTTDEGASREHVQVIRDVVPGAYQVVASKDDVKIRKQIIVESADEPLSVEVDIPCGTGTVSGAFITDSGQPLIMWNSQKTVTAHISPEGGTYRIEKLPAGHYAIGNYFLTDRAPVLDFELQEGQARTVDIDLTAWSPDLALLSLRVTNSGGIFLNHADVWLEGLTGQINPMESSRDSYGLMAPTSSYTLFVRCDGYRVYSEPVTLTEVFPFGRSRQQNYRTIRLSPE